MWKTQLKKRLLKNLLFTFLLSSWLTILSLLVFYSHKIGSLEGNSGIILIVIAGILWTLVLSLFSATLFLNIIDQVRNRVLLSFLTFYLLPISMAIVVFIVGRLQSLWQPFLIVTLSFVLVQTFFYIKFLNLKKGSWGSINNKQQGWTKAIACNMGFGIH